MGAPPVCAPAGTKEARTVWTSTPLRGIPPRKTKAAPSRTTAPAISSGHRLDVGPGESRSMRSEARSELRSVMQPTTLDQLQPANPVEERPAGMLDAALPH